VTKLLGRQIRSEDPARRLNLNLNTAKALGVEVRPLSFYAHYVAYWHERDMPKYLGNVRCWVNSGKHLLALSFSAFGPIAVIHGNGGAQLHWLRTKIDRRLRTPPTLPRTVVTHISREVLSCCELLKDWR
jgi:hypothetical protein